MLRLLCESAHLLPSLGSFLHCAVEFLIRWGCGFVFLSVLVAFVGYHEEWWDEADD